MYTILETWCQSAWLFFVQWASYRMARYCHCFLWVQWDPSSNAHLSFKLNSLFSSFVQIRLNTKSIRFCSIPAHSRLWHSFSFLVWFCTTLQSWHHVLRLIKNARAAHSRVSHRTGSLRTNSRDGNRRWRRLLNSNSSFFGAYNFQEWRGDLTRWWHSCMSLLQLNDP